MTEASEALAPRRVQLSRVKGWRMPPNTVKVDRTTRYGNPYTVEECGAYDAVQHFKAWLTGPLWEDPSCLAEQVRLRAALPTLRGKNLACWCKPGAPCHADVLLEIANSRSLSASDGGRRAVKTGDSGMSQRKSDG